MWDVGMEATMANREVGKSEWLRWGMHTRDAGQLRRVCQWLRDRPWALARKSAPRLGTGAMGRRRSEVRRCGWLAAEAGDSPAA
jgi:hypothetical protein